MKYFMMFLFGVFFLSCLQDEKHQPKIQQPPIKIAAINFDNGDVIDTVCSSQEAPPLHKWIEIDSAWDENDKKIAAIVHKWDSVYCTPEKCSGIRAKDDTLSLYISKVSFKKAKGE